MPNRAVPPYMNKTDKKMILYNCIYLLLGSCNVNEFPQAVFEKMQQQIDSIPRIFSAEQYSKDSLQIVNSIRWGFDNDDIFFNTEVRLGTQKSREINIYVDRIFYSPDSSQLFAIAILEKPTKFAENPDAIEKPENKYYYGGITIISNKKQNEKWVLYPLSWYRPSGWTYYKEVQFKFYYFFLNEMLTKKYFDYYQCTIDQDCFWSERNGYWRYGEIIPGYYNFQVSTHRDYFEATGQNVDSIDVEKYLYKPLQQY